MTTYERYLTAFSCSSTGAVAHQSPNECGDGEEAEAAQALGIFDGFRFRRGDANEEPSIKSVVLSRISKLIEAATVS